MRNARRTSGTICFFLFVVAAPAVAQSRPQTGAPTAATGPAYNVGIGYTYLSMAIPSAERVSTNGLDLSASIDLKPRWGATIDANGALATNILGTIHDGYVLTLQAGPVFYPIDHRKTRMLVRGLVGVGRVDSVVPTSNNKFRYGYVVRPAYAVGAGVEQSVSGRFAVRVVGDYLRTSFFDAAATIQPQNNFRLTVSLIFRLKRYQYKGF